MSGPIRITLSHYTLPNGGPRVHQVFQAGMPICRETENEADAARVCVDQIRKVLTGSVAGTSPRRVFFNEWDGDTGELLSDDAEVFETDALLTAR